MTLVQLEVFRAVVETGSFTKAGEVLGLTQSAISHAITGLESELGFPLLNRNRSGIRLTNEGKQMLDFALKILQTAEMMQQTAAAIKGLETGSVRIGVIHSVSVKWLPSIIEWFKRNHPSVKLYFFEGGYAEIEEWAISGVIDAGFVSLPTKAKLECIPLKQDRMALVVPDKHPLCQQSPPLLDRIAEYPFIMPKSGCDAFIKSLFEKHKIKPDILFEMADDQAILAMVQAGLGISILPEMTFPKNPEKVFISFLPGEIYRTIGIAFPSSQTLSPSTKAFIRVTKQWMGDHEGINDKWEKEAT